MQKVSLFFFRTGLWSGPFAACLFSLFLLPVLLKAENAVRPGQFTVEPPTLLNLGFDWSIIGDDNRNATVRVTYRKTGTHTWLEALPLLRIGGERVIRETEFLDYTVPHGFAGSILDLEPGTEYECRFTMTDPDGVQGEATQVVKVRTRTEPKAATNGRLLHVYPVDWKGPKQEPSFMGLKAAYYGSGLGDWSVVSERKVQPGDIILVHAGLYKADRLNYVEPHGIPFDGTYVLTAKGTADKPIVIRGAGDGAAIFDGAGAHRLFDVMATAHHIFENLTIRNTDVAFAAGQKEVLGATDLTVRNCRIEDVGIALTTEYAGSKNFYIADNSILGRDDRHYLVGWANPGLYAPTPLKSYFAIKVYGAGHVICHNAVAYFHDAITVSTYGTPDPVQKAVAIDIYNNDIHLMVDDFIEADGGVHNIRVMRNRGVNAAQCGLSAQPIFGGPAYFIRNVLYHIPTGCALKFMSKPAGLIVYHNTFISENVNPQTFSNAHFRNNLFLGTDAPQRPIVIFPNATAYSTSDYNGYRSNRNSPDSYRWVSPTQEQLRNYTLTIKDAQSFSNLTSLTKVSGLEAHGVELDYSIFQNLRMPDATKPHGIYHATDFSFQLKPKSKAVDAGLKLPNVNTNYKGKAPDLGAIEVGEPAPVYGPRNNQDHPFYR
ncbi:hypothetical protein AHMF7605_27595 [Adhaeribacter arboris]|uniref:Right handed beta helix domain-containing protein n=1 Tax=Adhaeribacter arboris TaxID=2072846 RepID=A0A2T2YN92_9BACT|nr:hypothetical protein [Adhaeribacter arboris]PSR56984.1 hypothetical protein AHMF7605_27595 [Adhaeribacter arboris]